MVAPQITPEKTAISEVNMEKQAAVDVAERGRDLCGRRGLLSLCFYAGAVTAALIVVIVLGIAYQKQSQEMCDMQQKTAAAQWSRTPDSANPGDEDGQKRHIKVKLDDDWTEDDVIESKNGRYETVLSPQANSSHPIITVIDRLRRIAGVYNPKREECYLIGGLSRNVTAGMKPDSDGVLKIKKEEALSLDVLFDDEVADRSLLPRQLHEICSDKPTYWMQQHTSTGVHSRQKRGILSTLRWVLWIFRTLSSGGDKKTYSRGGSSGGGGRSSGGGGGRAAHL